MKTNKLRMNLQLFADPNGGQGGEGGQNNGQSEPNGAPAPQTGQQEPPKTPEIDYEKLASVIEGKKAVAEDTVLKNFFKKQGLSKEEMDSAIGAYKKQKEESEPDPTALQAQVVQAQQLAVASEIEKEGVLIGVEMGLDVKTIPYVMKLADTSAVVVEGKLDPQGTGGCPGVKAGKDRRTVQGICAGWSRTDRRPDKYHRAAVEHSGNPKSAVEPF